MYRAPPRPAKGYSANISKGCKANIFNTIQNLRGHGSSHVLNVWSLFALWCYNNNNDINNNRYIGLHSLDASIGTGHYKYGEYQYVCTPAQIAAFDCFSDINMYQLFDLTKDPYELYNVYNETKAANPAITTALAKQLRTYYPCKGIQCP